MNYDEVLRGRIAELEKALEKTEKKMTPGPNAVRYAVDAEKIRYAIKELYICLGQMSSKA